MKRSSGPNLFQLLMLFPWWVTALLAPVVYWLLHSLLPALDTPNPLVQAALKALPALAPLVAGLLAAIAVVGLIRHLVYRHQRRRLLDKQRGIESIRKLTWLQFEWAIGEVYRRQGYRVSETAKGADDGVDLVLARSGEKIIVQCKHWRSSKVGVSPVRELLGTIHAMKANRGIFVCTGEYTRPAVDFANANGIELVDGSALDRLVKTLNGNEVSEDISDLGPEPSPGCPECGQVMVVRKANKGKRQETFWGCPSFPDCRGSRPRIELNGGSV